MRVVRKDGAQLVGPDANDKRDSVVLGRRGHQLQACRREDGPISHDSVGADNYLVDARHHCEDGGIRNYRYVQRVFAGEHARQAVSVAVRRVFGDDDLKLSVLGGVSQKHLHGVTPPKCKHHFPCMQVLYRLLGYSIYRLLHVFDKVHNGFRHALPPGSLFLFLAQYPHHPPRHILHNQSLSRMRRRRYPPPHHTHRLLHLVNP
mmetsp:Transcript_32763/g.80285  ORF Transcript_32763/g.80285 Transcript_32763/m.80285 type:complete len:204 (+) Transcript_32763:250-861(+)